MEGQRENVVLCDRLMAPRAGAIAGIVFSILFIRIAMFPRWMAFLGYALALLLLWVLVISVYVLLANLRSKVGARSQ
jgi:hypothetical protein